jgi:hypothetical protein
VDFYARPRLPSYPQIFLRFLDPQGLIIIIIAEAPPVETTHNQQVGTPHPSKQYQSFPRADVVHVI